MLKRLDVVPYFFIRVDLKLLNHFSSPGCPHTHLMFTSCFSLCLLPFHQRNFPLSLLKFWKQKTEQHYSEAVTH